MRPTTSASVSFWLSSKKNGSAIRQKFHRKPAKRMRKEPLATRMAARLAVRSTRA